MNTRGESISLILILSPQGEREGVRGGEQRNKRRM